MRKLSGWLLTALAVSLVGAMVARGGLVTVGSPSNTADETTGYGAVAYAYQISEFEVTAGEWCAFLNTVAVTDTHTLYNSLMGDPSGWFGCNIVRSGSPGSYTYSVAGEWTDRPVNYVSWYDAARYCNWRTTGNTESGVYDTSAPGWGASNAGDYTGFLDHRTAAATLGVTTAYFIPTEAEWYKAAYYDPSLNDGAGGYWDYPTRSDVPNTPSNQLTDPDPGNHATFDNAGYTIGNPYYRTEVGAHENSYSPFMTYDQGGNVWEWNETLISGSYRGRRGGSFGYDDRYLRAGHRDYGDPTYEWYYVGFRTASITIVPEPASALLLGLTGLLLISGHRRR